jgi:hypothetical protein
VSIEARNTGNRGSPSPLVLSRRYWRENSQPPIASRNECESVPAEPLHNRRRHHDAALKRKKARKLKPSGLELENRFV